jgi:hypothetical protein
MVMMLNGFPSTTAPQTTLWHFNFAAGVLSFGEAKIEEGHS